MSKHRMGGQTLHLTQNPPKIVSRASIVGKKEGRTSCRVF